MVRCLPRRLLAGLAAVSMGVARPGALLGGVTLAYLLLFAALVARGLQAPV